PPPPRALPRARGDPRRREQDQHEGEDRRALHAKPQSYPHGLSSVKWARRVVPVGAGRKPPRGPPEVVGEGMEGLSEFPKRAHGASGWASDGQLVGQTLPVPSKRCQDAFRGAAAVAHNAARELL